MRTNSESHKKFQLPLKEFKQLEINEIRTHMYHHIKSSREETRLTGVKLRHVKKIPSEKLIV